MPGAGKNTIEKSVLFVFLLSWFPTDNLAAQHLVVDKIHLFPHRLFPHCLYFPEPPAMSGLF
jgi:hypothetical protein